MVKCFRIQEKVLSLGGRFAIYDQSGEVAYEVEGSFLRFPKTFTIYDTSGQVVSRLEKHMVSLLPKFDVILQNGRTFTIQKDWSLFKPHYSIEALGLEVVGNFWEMDFRLLANGTEVATISQEWLRLTSTYNITVYDDSYADLVISLVIAIDYVKELKNAAN